MIFEARNLDLTTRDAAPQIGDEVELEKGASRRRGVLRVIAHWPVMGIWEVAVDGIRKPEIIITVRNAGFGLWREIAGR